MADDIADNVKLKPSEKLKILDFFDLSLKKKRQGTIRIINNLILLFDKFPFAQNYSRNLLVAFKLDATKKRYKDWGELIYYCKYSANPVGRFFIDLSYIKKNKKLVNKKKILDASDSLCTCLQIINHLQDCKEDYINLDRVYIPKSYFKKFSINVTTLKSSNSSKEFEELKKEIINKVEKLLSDIEKGLQFIQIWSLRKETFIILSIAKRLCFLLKRNDPLEKKIKLSRIDLIFCFIKGII
tara:strand:- start:4173 stop:4895 length:723 start_codon:yes stop_codon:yes gene_type:complete